MIRFLYWLAHIPLDGRETELSAAQKLRAFREKGPHFDTLSFETISAHGPSGALIHYQSSQSNRKLTGPTLTLVPFERYLIAPQLLAPWHIDWLNDYHQKAYETHAPHLEEEVRVWLLQQTQPI